MRRLSLIALAAACATPALAQAPRIVVDMPPTASLVQQVLGDLGEVHILLPRGASPHHHQLRPSDANALQQAQLLVWIGPELTPWLDKAAGTMGGDRAQLRLLTQPGSHVQGYAEAGGDDHDHDHDHGDHEDEMGEPQPPTVETSLPFGPTEQPFTGVADGEDAAGAAFALAAPNAVAPRPVRLQNGGLAILQLVERKAPAEEEWKEERDFYMNALRGQKQREALAMYMKRLRATHQAEIKLNKEFTKEFAVEAAPAGSNAPPVPIELP